MDVELSLMPDQRECLRSGAMPDRTDLLRGLLPEPERSVDSSGSIVLERTGSGSAYQATRAEPIPPTELGGPRVFFDTRNLERDLISERTGRVGHGDVKPLRLNLERDLVSERSDRGGLERTGSGISPRGIKVSQSFTGSLLEFQRGYLPDRGAGLFAPPDRAQLPDRGTGLFAPPDRAHMPDRGAALFAPPERAVRVRAERHPTTVGTLLPERISSPTMVSGEQKQKGPRAVARGRVVIKMQQVEFCMGDQIEGDVYIDLPQKGQDVFDIYVYLVGVEETSFERDQQDVVQDQRQFLEDICKISIRKQLPSGQHKWKFGFELPTSVPATTQLVGEEGVGARVWYALAARAFLDEEKRIKWKDVKPLRISPRIDHKIFANPQQISASESRRVASLGRAAVQALTVTSPKEVYRLGETMYVTVLVTNPSFQPLDGIMLVKLRVGINVTCRGVTKDDKIVYPNLMEERVRLEGGTSCERTVAVMLKDFLPQVHDGNFSGSWYYVKACLGPLKCRLPFKLVQ